MKRTGIFTLAFTLVFFNLFAQNRANKPKLIVGIVVDQMRQEYLHKYYDRYEEGGFKRLMNEGFMAKNGHYNYIPTYTGPGHASVYTGATPSTHGIIGNNWYVKELGKSIYCAEDSTVSNVGGTARSGEISPRNLLSTTVTDELRMATNQRSKVVGVAIKDRGASLPAGHLGDAYWYEGANGEFMTSTYYYESLPDWVKEFNEQNKPASYLNQTWETLYPGDTYIQSIADDNDFEAAFSGKDTPSFPYDLAALQENNGGLGMISSTPFGNSLTLDFALAALEGEKMGMGEETDFLALSFSSTDYVGHRFGPTSRELEDTYLRLDQEIKRLLDYLDENYGKGEYLVFLTADHAVADIPSLMQSMNMPGGYLNSGQVKSETNDFLIKNYGPGEWVKNISNDQIFLNEPYILEKGISLADMENALAHFLLRFDGIKEIYTSSAMRNSFFAKGRPHLVQMGYNQKASGNLMIILESSWLSGSGPTGTTHGSGYTYDTHVPILFYGWNVKAGQTSRYITITDIAPTVSMLLDIKLPSGATGQPILEITD
ncbi:alkaline phosphatase family protein [Algoriphagus halophytocola]|uniref:alkaline phosphatase PafA n=1 Tax=Algoriphagus halophytocola TaxID=2991499 RepID=UPI0022DE3235|nr:alkaline phosphatase PafA [Algoriphagus sp. TR-M9]WBL43503.1 alkaline phosphatase family protein [Algoriphagus sp. TR-M9]